MDENFWFIPIGLGFLWLGLQIFWVSGLPRQLKSGETATAQTAATEEWSGTSSTTKTISTD